jgi:hypothetical protein
MAQGSGRLFHRELANDGAQFRAKLDDQVRREIVAISKTTRTAEHSPD